MEKLMVLLIEKVKNCMEILLISNWWWIQIPTYIGVIFLLSIYAKIDYDNIIYANDIICLPIKKVKNYMGTLPISNWW